MEYASSVKDKTLHKCKDIDKSQIVSFTKNGSVLLYCQETRMCLSRHFTYFLFGGGRGEGQKERES